ncbi:putative hydroxymethylpyrimidine transporter CytX, partial [bacterium]|nr:putative hydroxymethylpyrimidine transporter CytX [bacterium]
ADFFILKRRSIEKAFVWTNLIVWVIGFVIYRYLMNVDFILGNTLPDMLITMVICVAANKIVGKKAACQSK